MKIFTSFFKKATPILVTVGMLIALPHAALAVTTDESLCKGTGGTYSGGQCLKGADTLDVNDQPSVMTTIKNITNILLYVSGAIAVIMIIVGGIRYATSGGEQAAITGAKNTVLYAIIGVIVTLLAYAAVNFVTTFIK
jgi:hypothetical protein